MTDNVFCDGYKSFKYLKFLQEFYFYFSRSGKVTAYIGRIVEKKMKCHNHREILEYKKNYEEKNSIF